ncbi:MAG: Rne/Rng family ribonuclease [Elainellaceae cyanobacterium]
MPKQIIIAEQHRIAAVFSEDQIQELIVATGSHQVGDIYLGIVENVLPGIDAAFVNIGDTERNGFIHVSDLGPLRLKRSAGSITELLAPQQKVLVQIMKEPTGNKGPRLTGNITLPGRYLVLMPFGRGVNLSRRIRNENERNRLRALAILVKPAGMGLLVRTEAEGIAEEAIIEDLEALQRQWENIQQEAVTSRPPKLLNRDDDFIQRVLRDVYSADVNRIVVDSHTGLKRVKQHLMSWSGGKSPQGVLIDHHRDRISILEYFRVNAAIREALKPRVDLPSGGYIIIETTEALTVIDVNSGSFTRSNTSRETVLWTNCEAASEIARQLRLRNVAGVIVVDFIDMDSRRDQLQVLEQFTRELKADKARPQVAQLSELGLVELTRKRQGQNIYELFGRPCATCGGLGHLVHLPGDTETVVHEIVEPPRTYPVVESRNPQLREVPDAQGEDFELETSSDLQELDLVNHPSYQERGGNNRRRRRRRGDLPSPRSGNARVAVNLDADESPDGSDDRTPAPPTIKEGRPDRSERGDRGDRPDRSERGDRSDRSKSSSRRDKTPEPPEVIAIEMTQQEQDVYALMGISPLVLATEPVKDSKSVIVNVVLPGQVSRSNGSGESDEQPSFVFDQSDSAASSESDQSPPSSESQTSLTDESNSDQDEETFDQTDLIGAESVNGNGESGASENGTSTRRRRRRRSSAADA